MGEGREKFVDILEKRLAGLEPTQEQIAVTDAARKFYINLNEGKVHKCVSHTMLLYIHNILPELSEEQAKDLTICVHTLVETVLTYLVEDGLIKEE